MSDPRTEAAAAAMWEQRPMLRTADGAPRPWAEVPRWSYGARYRGQAQVALAAADAADPLRQKRSVATLNELEELPVGSIIADFGKGGTLMDSPVIACKTAHGDWQVMGGPPERRWRSASVLEGAAGVPLTVLSNPAT